MSMEETNSAAEKEQLKVLDHIGNEKILSPPPRKRGQTIAEVVEQQQELEKQQEAEPQAEKSGSVNTTSTKKYVKDFTFGTVIGEGSYGAVVLGKENDTGREFAIKILEMSHLIKENKAKYAKTERDILMACSHPNIVRLYYTFKDDQQLFYVMEYCANGELLKQLNKYGSFDENCTAFYAAELINALEYLHQEGIIHRDLKPENILLDEEMHLKLTDFGTAKIIGNEKNARSNSFVGTPEYLSPELLNEKASYKASDLWALGCIIYQMIAGRPPFRGDGNYMTMQAVSGGQFTYPKGFPDVAKDLINQLLVLDPEKRLGAQDYKSLKSHPFFKGVNFETVHTSIPPSLRAYPTKLIFENEAVSKSVQPDETEKWKKFLEKEEMIVESGLVWKRKGRSVKKRHLILTDKPRIFYIDIKKNVIKGEIPWSQNLRPEAKNNTAWFIHTPRRTYILEDIPGKAQRWIDVINKLLETTKK